MSRIEELINKECPDGVEYKTLEQLENSGIITLGRGKVISKKDVQNNPGEYPIYSSSAVGSGIFGTYGDYMFDDVRLSWSIDGGGKFFYRDAPKYSVTNVCGWLTVDKPDAMNIRYLYFALTNEWSKKVFDYVHKAHPSVIRKEYTIPVPPLDIQEEIARTLDSFTELEAELEAELETEFTKRKQQFEHYRNVLFSFDDDAKVEWLTIADVCKKISSGGTPSSSRSDYYGGNIPWLRTQEVDWKDITDTGVKITQEGYDNSSVKWIPENCVIVAMYGATAAKTAINKIPLTTNQACCNLEINPDKALYRYVYHWLTNEYLNLKSLGQGSQSNINASTVKTYKIPIPSLDSQKRIVEILDNFDTVCNDISIGLPAEIEARRKQYEYYRDKLLTFKEKVWSNEQI